MLKRTCLSVFLLVAVACGGMLWAVACAGGKSTPTTPSPTGTRIIGLSGNLAFGNVQVGNTASATLTITNSGNSTLTVSGMNVTGFGSGVLQTFWQSGTIPAGGSQQSGMVFAPAAAQTYTGTLTVNGDQTSGTNTISASGTGTGTTNQCRYPQGKLRVQIISTRCQALSNACQTIYVVASSPQIISYLASGKAVCTSRSGNGCAVADVRGWSLLFCLDVSQCGTHDFDLRATFGPAMDNTAINITDTVSFCPFYADGTPAGNCVQALGSVQQCDTAGVILMLIN